MSWFGGSDKPVVTSSTSAPWAPAQPYLQDAMTEAKNLYQNDIGYRPWTGPTLTPLSAQSQQALNMTEQFASQGNPLAGQASGFAGGLLGNMGLTADQRANANRLNPIADGTDMQRTNPYLLAALDADSSRISDRVNSSMSGVGRYGSGAHTGSLTRELANSRLPVLAQDYENAKQRQMQAIGALDSTYGRGAAQGMQAASMVPGLYDAQLQPARTLAGVGDLYTQRAQTQLDDTIAAHNAAEARPWEGLGRFTAAVQGVGGMGGTQIGTQPRAQGPSTVQKALGGAAAGGSLFGPIGAFGGGLLGLLG
jgi:hypothetical protein